jgi:hypothetical protein
MPEKSEPTVKVMDAFVKFTSRRRVNSGRARGILCLVARQNPEN